MSNRFSFGKSNDPSPFGHWFRIGTLEVTTSVLVAILGAVALVVDAVAAPVSALLALSPAGVLRGRIWQLITWPFGLPGHSLWTVITIALFWLFARDLERQIGRHKFLSFLVGCTLVFAGLGVAMGVPLGGLNLLQFVVLLAFIAEYPHQRFFFNIPGWVIGVVLLTLQLLGYISAGYWLGLLHMVVGLALCTIVARSVGLLENLPGVPKMQRKTSKATKPKARKGAVVAGPWAGSGDSKDREALDALLDKISATGIDSLTAREKKQLMVLRDRLRGK